MTTTTTRASKARLDSEGLHTPPPRGPCTESVSAPAPWTWSGLELHFPSRAGLKTCATGAGPETCAAGAGLGTCATGEGPETAPRCAAGFAPLFRMPMCSASVLRGGCRRFNGFAAAFARMRWRSDKAAGSSRPTVSSSLAGATPSGCRPRRDARITRATRSAPMVCRQTAGSPIMQAPPSAEFHSCASVLWSRSSPERPCSRRASSRCRHSRAPSRSRSTPPRAATPSIPASTGWRMPPTRSWPT